MNNFAPIVLFAYNRPEHLQRTLDSLFTNPLAKKSQLTIFCDGAKPDASEEQRRRIEQVAAIAAQENRAARTHAHVSTTNQGLSASIRGGVSMVLQEHPAAIVLEDDLILGKSYLEFMNTALDTYSQNENVLQVSGFQFPFRRQPTAPFFMPIAVTLGWGTWKRAWETFDFSAPGYERLKSDAKLRRNFNLNGSYDYTTMLLRQVEAGRKDSWGVLFWWEVFRRNGYVLYPGYSLVQHQDVGNRGTHVSNYDHYDCPNWQDDFIYQPMPAHVEPDDSAFLDLCRYIRSNRKHIAGRVMGKLMALVRARLPH